MTDEKNEHKKSQTTEKIEAVGQIILGEIEKIGGILTGDPITQAEGDYNIEAGNLHRESNQSIKESEENEETDKS